MSEAERTCALVVIVRLIGDIDYLRHRIGHLKKRYSIPFLQDLKQALEGLSQDLEAAIRIKFNEEHAIPITPGLTKAAEHDPAKRQ